MSNYLLSYGAGGRFSSVISNDVNYFDREIGGV